MERKYEKLELELIAFEAKDVIMTSGEGDDPDAYVGDRAFDISLPII